MVTELVTEVVELVVEELESFILRSKGAVLSDFLKEELPALCTFVLRRAAPCLSMWAATPRASGTHTLGATGIHTPVATTTGRQFFFFSCFLSRSGGTHTLGATGIHTPVATTTHTLDPLPGRFFFLEVKDGI